ncbi:MAG: presenilin family intramembrane aspartyl protease [Thermoprotei archaeon]
MAQVLARRSGAGSLALKRGGNDTIRSVAKSLTQLPSTVANAGKKVMAIPKRFTEYASKAAFGNRLRSLKLSFRSLGTPALSILLLSLIGYAASMATGEASKIEYGVNYGQGYLGYPLTFSMEELAATLIILIVTFAALSVLLIRKKPRIFRRLLGYYVTLTLFVCSFELSDIWFSFKPLEKVLPFLTGFTVEGLSLAVALIVVFVYVFKRYSTFNLWGLIIATYLSVYLSTTLDPALLYALLGLLAVYDYVAVMKTGHMLVLADAAVENGNVLPLFVVAGGVRNLSEASESGKVFQPDSKAVKAHAKLSALGLGDIVFPAALTTSLLVAGDSALCAFALAGAVAGMVVNLLLLKKLQRPLPAIPALAGMIFLFSLTGILLHV